MSKKYEELIKSLQVCACTDSCKGCVMKKDVAIDCRRKLIEQAAEALEVLSKEVNELKRHNQWIEFKTRDLTEEEREDHPGWDDMLVGPLPEDGEEIIIYVNRHGHENVQTDVFDSDAMGCFLDSGYEIGKEVTHWRKKPLPPELPEEGQ